MSRIVVTLVGRAIPPQIQIGLLVADPPAIADGMTGPDFCVRTTPVQAGVPIEVPLTSLTHNCWNLGGDHFAPSVMRAETLLVQVVTAPIGRFLSTSVCPIRHTVRVVRGQRGWAAEPAIPERLPTAFRAAPFVPLLESAPRATLHTASGRRACPFRAHCPTW